MVQILDHVTSPIRGNRNHFGLMRRQVYKMFFLEMSHGTVESMTLIHEYSIINMSPKMSRIEHLQYLCLIDWPSAFATHHSVGSIFSQLIFLSKNTITISFRVGNFFLDSLLPWPSIRCFL